MTRLIGCVLFAMLLAGCRLDGQVDVAVNGDGGGTLAITLLIDEELRRATAAAGADPRVRASASEPVGGDPLNALEQAGRELRGWRVTRPDGAGQERTVNLSAGFRDPEQLEQLTTQFTEGLAGPELAPLGPMRVDVTDDTVTLNGTADLRVSRAVRELGLTRRQARNRLAEGVRFRVTARMPGTVLQTNADSRPDDTTVVWDIAPGERQALRVSATRPWTLARIANHLFNPYAPTVVLVGIMLIVAARRQRHHLRLGGAG